MKASSLKKRRVVPPAFLAACLLFLGLSSCGSKSLPHEKAARRSAKEAALYVQEIQQKKTAAVDAYIKSLSETERLAQLFVVNLEGDEDFWFCEKMRPQDKNGPDVLLPGGYIFFSFNINPSPEKIAAFTDSVRLFARGKNYIEPFLCLDAEGGWVNRLSGIAGELPENARVKSCLTKDLAFELYSLNAVQLKSLGFDINLSPVSEVETDSNRNFLDGRSFGSARDVVNYASSFVNAYKKNNVGSVLKHFPGNSGVDPHTALPALEYTEESFKSDVLDVFGALINCKPAGVLMSHAMTGVQGLCRGYEPAGLSGLFVQEILRSYLNFEGIVFSDDIFMSALEKNGFPPEAAVEKAVKAGVNCILMSEKRFINEFNLVKALYYGDEEFRKKADESVQKVVSFKAEYGILEYRYDGKDFTVCPAGRAFNAEERQKRLKAFYSARWKNHILYEEYFMPTASKSELRLVEIK